MKKIVTVLLSVLVYLILYFLLCALMLAVYRLAVDDLWPLIFHTFRATVGQAKFWEFSPNFIGIVGKVVFIFWAAATILEFFDRTLKANFINQLREKLKGTKV